MFGKVHELFQAFAETFGQKFGGGWIFIILLFSELDPLLDTGKYSINTCELTS